MDRLAGIANKEESRGKGSRVVGSSGFILRNDIERSEKMKIVEGYVVLSEKFEEIFLDHLDLLLVEHE